MLKGILWDNDGVLVDTEHLYYLSNKELLSEYNLDLTESDYFEWYLMRNIGSWHLLEGIGLTKEDQPLIRKRRNAIYTRKLVEATELVKEGIEPLVKSLYRKVPMGIVTSAFREHFDTIHARLKLRDYFDFVLTNEDYEGSKPSPTPYLCGLDRLGIQAENCVVIEDSPRGLAAARAANLRCIILRHKLMAGFDFQGAYKVVDSVSELQDVLMELM